MQFRDLGTTETKTCVEEDPQEAAFDMEKLVVLET